MVRGANVQYQVSSVKYEVENPKRKAAGEGRIGGQVEEGNP